tara:strand:- start:196 stop:459 length:264 start_codon:yes stop_codon:yes gene_type:complete
MSPVIEKHVYQPQIDGILGQIEAVHPPPSFRLEHREHRSCAISTAITSNVSPVHVFAHWHQVRNITAGHHDLQHLIAATVTVQCASH